MEVTTVLDSNKTWVAIERLCILFCHYSLTSRMPSKIVGQEEIMVEFMVVPEPTIVTNDGIMLY